MRLSLCPRTREQALTLWSFVGSTLAVVTGWIGVGLLIAGDRVAESANYHEIRLIPGHVHTLGGVLLALAVGMIYVVLTKFDRRSTWLLRVFAGVAFLVSLSFVGSWIVTHHIAWGGPFLWAGLGALAEGMVMFPPDALPTEGDFEHDAAQPDSGGRGDQHG